LTEFSCTYISRNILTENNLIDTLLDRSPLATTPVSPILLSFETQETTAIIMAGSSDNFEQYAAMLDQQKALLQKAKGRKGQRTPAWMKHSRWQLKHEFEEAV
jgi:hypothetical protein